MELSFDRVKEAADFNLDSKALRVFLKTLEMLGGPRELMNYRNLTWLPSLMVAAYTIVLHREYYKTTAEIAEMLGASRNTINQILRADPATVQEKIEAMKKGGIPEKQAKKIRTHVAGGLAKMAYDEIMKGNDEISLLIEFSSKTAESLGINWAVDVLARIKGAKFPLGRDELALRLSGMVIQGIRSEELVSLISFPINSPSILLKEIARVLREKGH